MSRANDVRIPVAVLGATGSVGQRFVQLLAGHPWFRLAEVVASDRSAGQPYCQAAEWRLSSNLPDGAGDLVVKDYGAELERRKTLKPKWMGLVEEEKQAWMERLRPEMESDEVPINPKRVLKALERHFPENGVLVADPSWARIGLLQQFEIPGPDRCYIVGGALPIGWSTAAAIGIARGRPEARVVAVTGDGGFLYHLSELETASRYGINTITIVNNNSGLGQGIPGINAAYGDRLGDREALYRFRDVNYAQIAEEMGCHGIRIEHPGEISGAIRQALEGDKPTVIEVVTDLQARAPVPWAP